MRKQKPDPTKPDPDNPEWSAEDFAIARQSSAALPPSLAKKLGVRGPQKAPTKEQINIRLSPSVLEAFRASGAGWQTRIDEALVDWLRTHHPA